MAISRYYSVVLFGALCTSIHAVHIINITPAPIYFSVSYKKGGDVLRQIPTVYTAVPNSTVFMQPASLSEELAPFDQKMAQTIATNFKITFGIQVATFAWPKQKCVEMSDAEIAGLAVGVAAGTTLTAGALGAAAGAGVGSIIGAEAAGASMGATQGLTMGAEIGGVAALGTGVGSALKRPCKAEHYPRTVLFSFDQGDIIQSKHANKEFTWTDAFTEVPKPLRPMFTQKKMDARMQAKLSVDAVRFLDQVDKLGWAFYFGDNIGGGKTYLLFYNLHGFDPRYAAYGEVQKYSVIKASKINSVEYSIPVSESLRRYIAFENYFYFGTE